MGVLEGKTALLTGGLGTLGAAQARLISSEGARLFLIDLAKPSDVPAHLASLPGVDYVQCDIGRLQDTEELVSALSTQAGGIDLLVNNAALIINRPFEDFSLAEYEDQIRVNSSSAFALARACAPGMKQKGYGKIVNFCSLVLNGRWDGYVPYVASKGATLGLTKSLARELGRHGVRVNAISPGAVVSDAEQRVFGDKLAEYESWVLENQSIKQRIQPDDIARLALFLLSPASDMISGQNIHVDGGW
jgi:NAD(P)-dependent dehydrogenase (short-subunit alcohol dehydrogenase family)